MQQCPSGLWCAPAKSVFQCEPIVRINPVAYAVCPGGEEAVLKTVGRKRLAGSNPVCSVRYLSHRGNYPELVDSFWWATSWNQRWMSRSPCLLEARESSRMIMNKPRKC